MESDNSLDLLSLYGVNLTPIILLSMDFICNALKWSNTYWYIPTSVVAAYLLLDFMHKLFT